jgi:hypothetical protein
MTVETDHAAEPFPPQAEAKASADVSQPRPADREPPSKDRSRPAVPLPCPDEQAPPHPVGHLTEQALPSPKVSAAVPPRHAPQPQGLAAVIDLADRRRTNRLTGRRQPVRYRPCPQPCCPQTAPLPWRCPMTTAHPCLPDGGPAA